ncbi:hypothetical protein L861_04640 [Litchfieldella anticariensis FP35 = DSM 16096]|uniref:Uncharacterized protein n=1 Tax=Litchfieldella anticariensis (strain DSM 16096 / CECT 5854 / CIP 108499 / LMG 22089 / FP35) TaxID=1121939 RepID=S2L9Q2_LITA3|nr:hypothetical protein [Halomonas anticariensis]EPC04614.1 hypothetical protein L861_04640 [Halomonas anticariensis FP35 = DSM 16096]
MLDLTALTFLPQEQLSLASAHERQEMHRYRRLALSFLPNAPHISRLMVALGKESEQRLDALRCVAEQLDLSACVAPIDAKEKMSLTTAQQHFFIIDDVMAGEVLEKALEAAQHAWYFAGRLLETNATPELHGPFLAFVDQKYAECRILSECLEQWEPNSQRAQTTPAHHWAKVAWLTLASHSQPSMVAPTRR